METIDLKKDIDMNRLRLVGKGIEGSIYEIYGNLIKIYNTIDIEILRNKENKLEILSHTDLACRPICLIKNNGTLTGYVMKKQTGYSSLEKECLNTSKRKKINNLYKIKEKLEHLHELGIIYGDIKLDNIITNGTNIEFCDLDNCYIDGYNFDILSNNQKSYLKRAQEINEQMDNYIFNLLSAAYISKIYEPYIIEYLKSHGLPFIFRNKENKEILTTMLSSHNIHEENIDLFINHVNVLRKK